MKNLVRRRYFLTHNGGAAAEAVLSSPTHAWPDRLVPAVSTRVALGEVAARVNP